MASTTDLQLQLAGRRRCETCEQMTLPIVNAYLRDRDVVVCSVCGTRYPDETDTPQT